MKTMLLNRLLFLVANDIHQLISTASILFYFLYHSQKATLPVDFSTIKQLVKNARAELEGVSIMINWHVSIECQWNLISSRLPMIRKFKPMLIKPKQQWTMLLNNATNMPRHVKICDYRTIHGNSMFNIQWASIRNNTKYSIDIDLSFHR
jgi:hypothetical protein